MNIDSLIRDLIISVLMLNGTFEHEITVRSLIDV